MGETFVINVSNHPISRWDDAQKRAAGLLPEQGGDGMDIPFPNVAPTATDQDVAAMADDLVATIDREAGGPHGVMFVHTMGEMTLTHAIVARLHALCYTVVASTTERVSAEVDGQKVSTFRFIQFRRYPGHPGPAGTGWGMMDAGAD